MIKKFDATQYLNQIESHVPATTLASLKALIADGPGPIGSSSRSAASVFRSAKMADVNRGWMPVGSKAERVMALTFEYSETTAGFISQPTGFPVSWVETSGKVRRKEHRPDFLIFSLPALPSKDAGHRSAARFVEVKDTEYLNAHASNGGGRYIYDDIAKRWRSPCAEIASQELYGLSYEVCSTSDIVRDIDPVLSNNGEFLHDFCVRSGEEVAPDVAKQVLERIALEPGVTLRQLLNGLKEMSSDLFFRLLVDGRIFVDLRLCQLDLPEDVRAFGSREVAEAYYAINSTRQYSQVGYSPSFSPGEQLIVCGRNLVVVLATEKIVHCKDEQEKPVPLTRSDLENFAAQNSLRSLGIPAAEANAAFGIFKRTPPKKLHAAFTRYERIKDRLLGSIRRSGRDAPKLSPADRYWLSRARQSLLENGCGLLGCIDQTSKRGRRPAILTATQQQALDAGINIYASKKAPSLVSSYTEYRLICEKLGVRTPLSLKAFRARLKRLLISEVVRAREGAGAAAQYESPHEAESLLDFSGRYFFHAAYFDEFVFDLSLIERELGLGLGQAWAIALIDSYSRTILALIVTFQEPSYVTSMMALRACVCRWKRLPRNISMDNGPGFRNASLTLFLKYYSNIHPIWRKIESPRGGSIVERFGGSTNQRIANELPGATKVFNRHRGRLSKSHEPERLAVSTLMDADATLSEWAYEIYDTLPHSGLNGRTPRQVRECSLRDHGERDHLRIEPDRIFSILSLPAPDGDGTLKVQARDGVQVDGLLYWHTSFALPDVEGSRVQVRWDPFDITTVYAYVVDEWVKCNCIKLLRLRRLSREHLCALTFEIRRGRRGYGKNYNNTLKTVRDFVNRRTLNREDLEGVLRAKQSAQIAANQFPFLDLDDDDTLGMASKSTPPIPGMPGGCVSEKNYDDL